MEKETKIIFERALNSLKASKINLENGFYHASINRSYYAVFYASKALLLKKGITTKKHSGNIRQFGLKYVINDKFDKNIASILSNLEEDREDVDYDFSMSFTEKDAINDLEDDKLFIEECKKFINK